MPATFATARTAPTVKCSCATLATITVRMCPVPAATFYKSQQSGTVDSVCRWHHSKYTIKELNMRRWRAYLVLAAPFIKTTIKMIAVVNRLSWCCLRLQRKRKSKDGLFFE